MSEQQLNLFQEQSKEQPIKVFKVKIDGFGELYMDQATYDFIDLLSKKIKDLEKDNKRLEKEVKKLSKELKNNAFLISQSDKILEVLSGKK